MANLSLREVNQSQLESAPIVDGQLIVCKDTGNMYRDFGKTRIQAGRDIEFVAELPLAHKTVVDNALSQGSANPVANSAITKRLQYLYSFKISRDKWNESSDKSNWNVIVPWSDSSGTALTGSTAGTPNLTTGMSLGPAMMERTSSLSDNIILSGELSMINQGQIYVCDTNKLSFTVKRRPVCDLMLYFYARQWTT